MKVENNNPIDASRLVGSHFHLSRVVMRDKYTVNLKAIPHLTGEYVRQDFILTIKNGHREK